MDKMWIIIINVYEKLDASKPSIDIAGFFIASGFALLVVLVGWADQITSRSKETKEIETRFLNKAKLRSDDYKRIVKDKGATEDSFKSLVDFLFSNPKDNLEIFENIKLIKVDIKKLDKYYTFKFWILLCMSICFFITGIITMFFPKTKDLWVILPNIVFVIIVYVNLIKIHNLEKKYLKNISETMEKL